LMLKREGGGGTGDTFDRKVETLKQLQSPSTGDKGPVKLMRGRGMNMRRPLRRGAENLDMQGKRDRRNKLGGIGMRPEGHLMQEKGATSDLGLEIAERRELWGYKNNR